MGGLRARAQTISYEISLVLILLFPVFLIGSLQLRSSLSTFPILFVFIYSFSVWFVTCLAETNRAPFDFAEGESELVSGFNIEYAGGLFALLFLAEYASILFIRYLTGALFLYTPGSLIYLLGGWFLAGSFLLIRGAYPRYRYDMLISLCWKSYLPLRIGMLGIRVLLINFL